MECINSENTLKDSVEDIIKRTSALREVTYKYIELGDGLCFNKTIFCDYADISEEYSKHKNGLKFYARRKGFLDMVRPKVEEKLITDIEVLQQYLGECEDNEKPQIEQLIASLEFTKNGLDFELEAAGYEHGLSDEEIKAKIQIQEDLDEKMFGEHVSKNSDFILESYVYTRDLLEKKGGELSQEQKAVLDQSQQDMLMQVSSLQGIPVDEIQIPEFHEPEKSEEFKKLSKIKIPREDYTQIFDMFFEVADVRQRSKIGSYGSFYDGDDHYGVPDLSSYDHKTLEELLRLAPHETSHYINLRSTEQRNDGKQAGDMLKEEGVSMITEALVSGANIDKMSYMTFAGPSVVMNRLYSGEQYADYQDAYLQLLEKNNLSEKGDVLQKTLRKKRGFHKSYAGGTNKDAMYALGSKGVLGHIRNPESEIQDLFGGKISLDQMKSGDYKPENFGNLHIRHILLSELIFYYLQNKNKEGFRCSGLHEGFVRYLKDKYKHFSEAFNLFDEAEKFCFKNKRSVVKILKMIEKAEGGSETENETSLSE